MSPPVSSPTTAVSGRLLGLDIVRGLAVLGMITVHVAGRENLEDPTGPWVLLHQAAGFSAGTFAVSAGVALSLTNPVDPDGRVTRSWAPTVVRGLVLFLLGLLLEPVSRGILVILCVYGALFVVAAPLRRLPALALAGLGAVLAVVWPVVSLLLRRDLPGRPVLEVSWDVLTGPDPLVTTARTLFLDGTYPVPTWLTLALLAWAAHRGGLLARDRRRALAGTCAALVVAGFGGAALAERLWHPRAQQIAALVADGSTPSGAAGMVDNWFGTPPTTIWPSLLTAGRHTGTTLELLQILAVAGTAYLLASMPADAAPEAARVLAWPGRVALTLYAGHLVVLWGLQGFWLAGPETAWPSFVVALSLWVLAFVVGAALRTTRGPLEELVRELSRLPEARREV